MKGIVLTVSLAASLVGCRAPDSIDRLARRMTPDWCESHTHCLYLELPAGAPIKEVAFNALNRPDGYIVLETRRKRLEGWMRDVVFVLADVKAEGKMIVLADYVEHRGWWTQVYDAE